MTRHFFPLRRGSGKVAKNVRKKEDLTAIPCVERGSGGKNILTECWICRKLGKEVKGCKKSHKKYSKPDTCLIHQAHTYKVSSRTAS